MNINNLTDSRILSFTELITPNELSKEIDLDLTSLNIVNKARKECVQVLKGNDSRLLVFVGPCSIHDPESALEYGHKLKKLSDELQNELVIIMRAYIEKPRTSIGWKGLINDPNLDNTCDINLGLKMSRKLYHDLVAYAKVPVGAEILDPLTHHYFSDYLSYGVIGARTTESQLHREFASGLSFPVGFKNTTDGRVDATLDAINACINPHKFLNINNDGKVIITQTKGNDDCFLILRGGKEKTNYDKDFIQSIKQMISNSLTPDVKIMVDCSHDNSRKDHRNQFKVLEDVSCQIENGQYLIVGIMIESHIYEGKQDLLNCENLKKKLKYGVSITDSCVSWETTVSMLKRLSEAVKKRNLIKKNSV